MRKPEKNGRCVQCRQQRLIKRLFSLIVIVAVCSACIEYNYNVLERISPGLFYHYPQVFCGHVPHERVHVPHERVKYNNRLPRNNVTVVSGYFDLGSFAKGEAINRINFTTETYRKWGQIFSRMENVLVFYTDSQKFATLMKSIRKGLENRTSIHVIDRNSSWAFRREQNISKIYHSNGYPKHSPNTVIPAYTCVQHAKYDVIARAARTNVFNTRYFVWIDVGYFRLRSSNNKHFIISTPVEFDESKIAMNLIAHYPMYYKPDRIIKDNVVWVGGGLFLGRTDVVIRYEKQYKSAVDYFLSIGLMNTDQQILFAMFSDQGRSVLKPEIWLQLYKDTSISAVDWYYLGNSMLHELM